MTTLMLYVGTFVTFLTLGGVVLAAGYLIDRQSDESPTALNADATTERSMPTKADLIK